MKAISFYLLLLLLLFACKQHPASQHPELTISTPYEITTLDPHRNSKISSFAVLSHFYEPLVSTSPGMKIRPHLAESWENPDQYTWIFHLRNNVYFHNGKPFTAADVVYTFERVMKSEGMEVSVYATGVESVVALSSYSVQVRTKEPTSILLNKLSFVPILPTGVEEKSLEQKIEGTGPYKLEFWRQGEKRIRIIANENYWSRPPVFSRVNLLLGRNTQQAIDSLLSGESQLIQCNSKKLLPALQNRNEFQTVRKGSLYLKFLGFNFSERSPYCSVEPNPFRNLFVRQAIHSAINRANLLSRLETFAVAATQPLPPFTFGFHPEIQLPEHSVQRSRELMAKAGLPEGFEVEMLARDTLPEAAPYIQEQLRQIGIRVEVRVLPDPEFFARLRSRDFAFYLSRFGCPSGDASDILENAIHSADPKRHYGGQNYGRYSNPTIDQAIEESAGIAAIDERRLALQKIMSMTVEDLVWIPLYVDQDLYAYHQSLRWQPRNDGFILAHEISLETGKKSANRNPG